jgi:hypothetical protein
MFGCISSCFHYEVHIAFTSMRDMHPANLDTLPIKFCSLPLAGKRTEVSLSSLGQLCKCDHWEASQ